MAMGSTEGLHARLGQAIAEHFSSALSCLSSQAPASALAQGAQKITEGDARELAAMDYTNHRGARYSASQGSPGTSPARPPRWLEVRELNDCHDKRQPAATHPKAAPRQLLSIAMATLESKPNSATIVKQSSRFISGVLP